MAIKRASSAGVSGSAKKPRSTARQCSVIEKAIQGAEGYPAKTVAMLAGNLENCLGVPTEDRHEFQEKIVDMVGQVLTAVDASMQKHIEAAEVQVSTAGAEKKSRQQAHEAAAAAVTSKVEGLEVAKLAVMESTSATKAAKAALVTAESAQGEGNTDIAAAEKEKALLDCHLTDSFKPLKEGGISDGQRQSCIEALAALAQTLELDSSMQKSLPTALAKAPADCTAFEGLVWQQLEEELTKRIKGLDDKLHSADPDRAQRAEAVTAAKAALEAAQANTEKNNAILQQCKDELDAAKNEHKDAAKAVATFGAEMKQVEKQMKAAKAAYASFTDGAMAAYNDLRVFRAILPPAAEGEPEATQQY